MTDTDPNFNVDPKLVAELLVVAQELEAAMMALGPISPVASNF